MSAVLEQRSPAASPWRTALPAFLVVIVAILALFRETFAAMVEIWHRSETFAHAFLVPPIALWLVWRQRERIAALAPRPQPLWLLPMALVGAGWLVGQLATVNALMQFCATALLVLAVPAVLGHAVASALVFPLAFLFFMVPVGEFLLPLLMEFTADFTVAAVRLSGVPLYREGLQFVIPSGTWSVVEACSGVRYLIASFMVGTLFAYLNYRSTTRRLVFCGVAIVVPIVANWLRAYMIVMLGHLSDNRIATGVDHLLYGWVFFGVVIALMFFIGARWSEPDAAPTSPPSAGAAAAVAAPLPGLVGWWVLPLALAVVAAPHFALDRIEHQVRPGAPALALPPTLPGGWTLQAAPADGYRPVYVGAAAETGGVYRNAAGAAVGVHVAYYRAQGPGRKLVSSENVLTKSNDADWNQVEVRAATLEHGGRTIGFRRGDVRGGSISSFHLNERLEVRQLLWVGGRWVAGAERAALAGVLGRLAGEGDDAAGVVLHASAAHDPAAARATLDAFMGEPLATLEAALAATREGRR